LALSGGLSSVGRRGAKFVEAPGHITLAEKAPFAFNGRIDDVRVKYL
jgi:hypothetical protein